MRVVDLGEWRVLRGVHPHLVSATDSALQSLASDDQSTNLRYTLEFLHYELQSVVIVVPTHRNLDDDAISLFKTEVSKVFPLLDKLLTISTSCLLDEVARSEQISGDKEWMGGSFEALRAVPLVDQVLCSSVVSALESFNRCMEGHFRAQLRQSTPLMMQSEAETVETSFPRFDGRYRQATEALLGALQKQLTACRNDAQHQILLQLAGRAWKAAKRGPMSLYLSSCEDSEVWQEIEHLDEVGSDMRDVQCVMIPELCAAILDSLSFNELFRLHTIGQTLYKISSYRDPPRQQNGVPAVSLGQLIETSCFQPLSSDHPLSAGFTVSEKRELTLDLSWCLMHLFNCKWTDDCWLPEKIFLLATPNESDNALLAGVPPYIVCEQSKSPTNKLERLTSLLGDSLFLNFGKLLVEIETGHKVVATEKNNRGLPSLWLTIGKIINEGQMFSASDSYLKAIEGCLNLHRETYHLDPREHVDELSKRIYDSIVVNLEQDYGHYRSPPEKRPRSLLQKHGGPLSEAETSTKTGRDYSAQKRKLLAHLNDEGDEEEEDDLSQHEKAKRVQSIIDELIPKRARLQSSLPTRKSLVNGATHIRRSQRIAVKARACKQTLVSCSHAIESKGKMSASHRIQSTSVGGRTKGFEIFDDIPEQLHDGRTVAISKSFFEAFNRFLVSYLSDPSEYETQKVKICVIDTGLDMTHPSVVAAKIAGRLKAVKSWKGAPTDVTDNHGHGTHVADLVLRLAPESDLYVAKVANQKFMPKEDTQLIVQEDWALSQDVDIISMSFGLDVRDDDLDNTINRAAAAGKILLAAAGNHGNNGPRTFPATNRNVICIHASDGKGKDGRISPQPVGNDDNFMTLGIAVPLIWLSEEVFRSGTSFATPIAAGIAANVLEIAKRTINMTNRQRERLHSCDGMRRVFQLLSPMSDGGYRYVVPWSLWNSTHTDDWIRMKLLEELNH